MLTHQVSSPASESLNSRLQTIGENLLLVPIRFWLSLGTIDPMILSYMLFVAVAFSKKWKVKSEGKVLNVLNRVKIYPIFSNE